MRQAADDTVLPEMMPAVGTPPGTEEGTGEPVGDVLTARSVPTPPPEAGPTSKHSDLPTIEGEDLGLATALADLKKGPNAAAYRVVASEYSRLGVLDMAWDNLTLAIDLAPKDAASYDARARVWRDWGQSGLGLADAARAVYYEPTSAAAHNTLGTLLFALGQLDEAQSRFEIAMALAPDAAWIRSNLCYTGLMRGDAVLARERCEEALDREATLATARNNLALVDAALERDDDARRVFAEAAGEAASHYNMGLVYLSRREYDLAAAEFDEASRQRPDLGSAFARALEAQRLLAEQRKGR